MPMRATRPCRRPCCRRPFATTCSGRLLAPGPAIAWWISAAAAAGSWSGIRISAPTRWASTSARTLRSKRLQQVDVIVGDLRRLPVADGSFTKAFSLDVAEHLSRESLIDMLKEAGRVLVPGGSLFLYTHVRKNSPLALGLRMVNKLARVLDRVGLISLQAGSAQEIRSPQPVDRHSGLRAGRGATTARHAPHS